jgi:glutamate/tyrosine decarboxylase-like PLP-dependent enzyme
MLGMGSRNLTLIDPKTGNREAMDIEKLEQELMLADHGPFILLTSAGTVNSADFDDFNAISELRKKYTFWWHIDAAFGGFAACSPKYKYLVDGWQHADSITIDCHKWLNVPYESAVFFIKESHTALQTETFQNSNAPYLETSVNDFGYLNFIPENSRRLKALPAWFTLIAYGKQGYKDIVENSICRSIQLASYIERSSQFELLTPVRLNTVCFAIKNGQQMEKFLYELNSSRLVYMSPTIYQGKKCIRAAFVNWRTIARDVDMAIAKMTEVIESLIE